MNRVVHFEVHAADPERAAGFYRRVFGWDVKEDRKSTRLNSSHRL